MKELSDKQKSHYLYRSYGAVDGLWFMKVEEKFGFGTALEIDREVWKILPKIQARMLKNMLALENGIDGLAESLDVRLSIDGFDFKLERESDSQMKIVITGCPWHQLMEKSGRASLSGRVGDAVCVADYNAWAKEFGSQISFNLSSQICKGDRTCVMNFANCQVLE